MPFVRFPKTRPPFLEIMRAMGNDDRAWFVRRLKSGERFSVGIIGGGPAGSFLAHLLALGAEELAPKNLRNRLCDIFDINVFESRDASIPRRKGCGLGSGVFIAEDFEDIGLLEALKENGAPAHPIEKFTHVSPAGSFSINLRERFPGYTLFATNRSTAPSGPSLDFVTQAMLEKHRLVKLHRRMVTGMRREGGVFKIVSADNDGMKREDRLDFIAGAYGVNGATARMFQEIIPSLKPPVIKRMIQRELKINEREVESARHTIYVFSIPTPPDSEFSIHFLALTPKVGEDGVLSMTATIRYAIRKPGLTINPLVIFNHAISHPLVKEKFSDCSTDDLDCVCVPFAVVAQAESVVDNGAVVLGDAGLAPRLYKNGLSGAYISARILAEALLLEGPSRASLRDGFENVMRRRFNWRNRLGLITMNVYDRLNLRWRAFSPIMSELIKSDDGRAAIAAISTGVLTYPDIFLKFVRAGTRGAAKSVISGRLRARDAARMAISTIVSKPWKFKKDGEELIDEDICGEPLYCDPADLNENA